MGKLSESFVLTQGEKKSNKRETMQRKIMTI